MRHLRVWGQPVAWLVVASVLMMVCLFGSVPGMVASCRLGPVMQEVLATFRDAGTQWMVFVCCGMFLIIQSCRRRVWLAVEQV